MNETLVYMVLKTHSENFFK